jgi:hypothetical protein
MHTLKENLHLLFGLTLYTMKRQFLVGLFALIFGGLIYILFRQDTLKMFNWFNHINLSGVLFKLRLYTLPISEHLPKWFIYSLPDGLWLFSYLSVLLVIWGNTISKQNIYWLLSVPLIAIFSEIGQFFEIISGTFDILDLIFYIAGTVMPILTFTNSKITKYEKNN